MLSFKGHHGSVHEYMFNGQQRDIYAYRYIVLQIQTKTAVSSIAEIIGYDDRLHVLIPVSHRIHATGFLLTYVYHKHLPFM